MSLREDWGKDAVPPKPSPIQKAKAEVDKYLAHFQESGLSYRTAPEDEGRRFKEFRVSRFFESAGERVLDFGCGTATFSRYLAKNYSQVIGIDIVSSNLRVARAIDPSSDYICADGVRLPFKDESFDAVLCGTSLHHFPDLLEPLSEIWRVLIPGGLLFAFEPNKWNPITWYKHWDKVKHKYDNSINEHALSCPELKKALSQTGFEVLEIRGIDFTPRSQATGIWRFARILEPLCEQLPLVHLFGGGLVVRARKKG